MFTEENTLGTYSAKELELLNDELAVRLDGVEDDDKRAEIEKNFSDEVARRY